MKETKKTTMQLEKDTLTEFNRKKYFAMAKKEGGLSNDEFLRMLLEAYP